MSLRRGRRLLDAGMGSFAWSPDVRIAAWICPHGTWPASIKPPSIPKLETSDLL